MVGTTRTFLEKAFLSGVEACQSAHCLPAHLPSTPPPGKTIILGAGKAAGDMARVAAQTLAGDVTGLVVTRPSHAPDQQPGHVKVIEGGHPVPNEYSRHAALKVLARAHSATAEDRVIFLVSGGGSALLSYPADGVTMREKCLLNKALINSGASIQEINLVRTHVSRVKGGKLAEAALPAELLTLVISDVVGDDPALVASGPSVPGRIDRKRAREILGSYGIEVSPGVAAAIDATTPVADAALHPVKVIARAADALSAIATFLTDHGWRVIQLGGDLEGDASEVGQAHGHQALAHLARGTRTAVISGGELTVKVLNPDGRGGPNLEYLSSLMITLDGAPGVHALACDSDGIDGSEDNAGGYIEPDSLVRAAASGVSPHAMLAANRSYDLFQATGGLIRTGPTQTNVNDIRIILIDPRKSAES